MNLKKHLSNPNAILIVILFFLIICVSRIGSGNIPFSDELLFEDASFYMAKHGSWLTPHLNSEPWLEKPPLYFWFTAGIFKLISFINPNILMLEESTPNGIYIYPEIRRLVALISGVLILTLTYKTSQIIFKKKHYATTSAILLGTSYSFVFFSTIANLDILSTLFVTGFFYLYIKYSKIRLKEIIILSTIVFLATMSRSLLALIPLMAIPLHALIIKNGKFLKTITALAMGVLLSLPWHLFNYATYKEEFVLKYFSFNLIEHSIDVPAGYSTTPFYFYLLLIIVMPWTLFAFYGIYRYFKYDKIRVHFKNDHLLLVLWTAVPTIVLSIAKTRHLWYITPVLPAVALLATPILLGAIKGAKYSHIKKLLTYTFIIALGAGNILAVLVAKEDAINVSSAYVSSRLNNGYCYSFESSYYPITTLFRPCTHVIVENIDENIIENEISIVIPDESKDELQSKYEITEVSNSNNFMLVQIENQSR